MPELNDHPEWGPITNLLEIAVPSEAMRVDRDAGVIRGVRVLGAISLNGRRYSEQAMKAGLSLYENRPVNLDHVGDLDKASQRKVSDRFGWLKDVTFKEGGLVADLHYIKHHPLAESVAEVAERNPSIFGLSHNADGRMTRRGQEHVVEEIVGVRSVDLVADPATTKSLFESLQEMTMDQVTDPVVPPAAEEPTDVFALLSGKLREIFKGDGDASAKASAMNKIIRQFLKLEDALSSADEPAQEDAPTDAPAEESAVMKELSNGLKTLTEGMAEITKRMDAMQDALKTPAKRPFSKPLTEGKATDFVAPKDSKELVHRLTGR